MTEERWYKTKGDFIQPAIPEVRLRGRHVELIDFHRFINLRTKYYDKMNDDPYSVLPLH